MKFVDLTGQRFGRLVAVRLGPPHHSPSRAQVTWECQCDCGNIVTVQRGSLRSGTSRSCGCSYKDLGVRKRTSRFENRTEYTSWFQMKQRCTNKSNSDYHGYGGRGIKIDPGWMNSFDKFFSDMGNKPGPEYSLDRIDVDGDYTRQNCRWATPLQQSRNRRNTKYYTPNNTEKEDRHGT